MYKGCLNTMRSPQTSQQKPQQSNKILALLHNTSRTTLRFLNFCAVKSGYNCSFFYTKSQIADWCMMSQSSVVRARRELQRLGILQVHYTKITPEYNEPNRYWFTEGLMTDEVRDQLEVFFKNFCKFALFTILSKPAPVYDDIPYILKRNYGIDIELLSKYNKEHNFRTMTDDERCLLNLFNNHQHPPEIEVPFASHQARQTDRGLSITAPRGTPSTLEAKTPKRETREFMNNQKQLPFTEEQLLQLAEFPREAIDHANKALTKELMAGKAIANQFGYFLSCCKNFKPYQSKSSSQKTSTSTGKARPSTFSFYVQGGKWVPGAEVINNDRNFQTTITHVETDEEFATNFERLIHARTLSDPELAKRCARFDKNPLWVKMTDEQKATIWQEAHTDSCNCRRNEQAGLIMPDIAQKLAEKNPMVKPLAGFKSEREQLRNHFAKEQAEWFSHMKELEKIRSDLGYLDMPWKEFIKVDLMGSGDDVLWSNVLALQDRYGQLKEIEKLLFKKELE